MKYAAATAALIPAVLFIVYISTFTVSQREHIVLTQFGKPTRTIIKAGLHWKRPGFLETVNRIDCRIHTFTTQPIQLLLGDKNPIVLTCYICWRVSKPLLFFQSLVSTDIAVQKLGDMVNSQLGNALGDFGLSDIINTDPDKVLLGELENTILRNTNTNAGQKYGIEVVQVGIRRMAYPAIVADAVYNRMRSERQKEAKKYRAEGKEEAAKIKARTDREVAEIIAEAEKKAHILRGEGERQALKIYSQVYGRDREFFQFTKSMDVYKELLGSNSTIILSTDSDLFKYFTPKESSEK